MIRQFVVQNTPVLICADKKQAGYAAGERAEEILAWRIAESGQARIIVGTGNSQEQLIRRLAESARLRWKAVTVFHMDEYLGMPEDHPASFRRWLKSHLVELVHPGTVRYLAGDAEDPQAECVRYGRLLLERPIDICFIGFGENGHIAFNDPHVADLNDALAVKVVSLDERTRRQQVGEGHFADLDSVPRQALTLTVPSLLSARYLVCTVPEGRKAAAVDKAIQIASQGSPSPDCPASAVFFHTRAEVFLDLDSASLLDH